MSRVSVEGLRALHDRLWESQGYPRHKFIRERAGVRLPQEQWEEIEIAIRMLRLACVLDSGAFGFGLSLSLYEGPLYPGLPVEHVLTLTNKHLFPEEREPYNETWALFEPIGTSPWNVERLHLYGLPLPKPHQHYLY